MTPRLEACYFEASGGSGRWARMARVLAYTAARHCPGWRINVEAINSPRRLEQLAASLSSNTHKLARWAQIVQAAADGDQLLFMDADAIITNPIDDIWAQPFDLAYTTKPGPPPFNGGVIFMRVSDRTKRFVAEWSDENERLLQESVRGVVSWSPHKWGGVNQASLARLLARSDGFGVQVLGLPCAEWNCEDTSWASFDPARTRIVHIKGDLRGMLFNGPSYQKRGLMPLAEYWRALDRQASAQPVGAR